MAVDPHKNFAPADEPSGWGKTKELIKRLK